MDPLEPKTLIFIRTDPLEDLSPLTKCRLSNCLRRVLRYLNRIFLSVQVRPGTVQIREGLPSEWRCYLEVEVPGMKIISRFLLFIFLQVCYGFIVIILFLRFLLFNFLPLWYLLFYYPCNVLKSILKCVKSHQLQT